jgi:biopolymer transport protein ExbD
MSPNPKSTSRQLDEKQAAAILVHRAGKKVPNFFLAEELNLVPYLDVMVNLIIFMLVTISAFLPIGILSIFPPASGGANPVKNDNPEENVKPQLTLTVFITNDEFTIAGIGGVLPPVPNLPTGEHDYVALTQKAQEIKDTYPTERQVIIAAVPDIRYEVLIKTMDALRNKDDRILFDTVKLSPGLK